MYAVPQRLHQGCERGLLARVGVLPIHIDAIESVGAAEGDGGGHKRGARPGLGGHGREAACGGGLLTESPPANCY
jgi:hypothetical protein